ncbi:MAG: DUF1844 domain-containing protein [Planctomycetes bacterium]|nr:DUF1844 domain-containing protein [Planctomycetota bacterium]NQU50100.1 DUF1844 domain-containing protein [Planctomycetota bacterium]
MTEEQNIPGGDFRLFAQKLATQGFYALGLFEIPGMDRPEPNLQVCQSVIDDLMMIREKTEGNLDDAEKLTLDKFISDLQFQYLEVQKKLEASAS